MTYSWWRRIWQGMPEFVQEDIRPYYTIRMHINSVAEQEAFLRRAGKLYHGKWLWYPPRGYASHSHLVWRHGRRPIQPVYIVSKGRWDNQLTSNALERMDVPHYIVVEEQEHAQYKKRKNASATLLKLNPAFQETYETFDDLGDTKSKGPGPARNFAWWHAQHVLGADWHWVMDDNIDGFYRLNRNEKRLMLTGTGLYATEALVRRYANVPLAGLQYELFTQRREPYAPLRLNTRIYSCLLIRNDLSHHWRGRYNEDTDLSLRVLKDGNVTMLLNAFLANKIATQRVPGGNTKEFYDKEGTLPKSNILIRMHGDVARVVWKWGRWHHHVNYQSFAHNAPVLRKGCVVKSGIDEFGMILEPR